MNLTQARVVWNFVAEYVMFMHLQKMIKSEKTSLSEKTEAVVNSSLTLTFFISKS